MGQRVALIVGLALWFPLLRGEFFTPDFPWPVEGPLPTIAFNVVTICVALAMLFAQERTERLLREHPELVTACSLACAGLLLPFAVSSPSLPVLIGAVVTTAASFCLLAGGWGTVCFSLHQDNLRGALFDIAAAYALSYFTMLPGIAGALPGALRALCATGSGIALYLSVVTGSLRAPLPRPVPPGTHRPLFRDMAIIVTMYFVVELISAVLVGIFIPAGHPGSASPWRSWISLASAVILVLLWLPRKKALPPAVPMFFGMAVILVGSLLLMSNIDPLVDFGTHVLTCGRRLCWTLLWMQLLNACYTTPLHPAAAVGGLFPLAFMAARIPVNVLRIVDPARFMAPEGIYATSLVLSLLLIASALALAWLEALRSRKALRADPVSPAQLDSESLRGQVAAELATSCNLTEREQAVLGLLSRGYTVKRIADELCVSDNTVRAHTKAIYRKVGCHSKQELVDLVETRMGTAKTGIPGEGR